MCSLILDKLFSRSSFYGMASFSILTSGPHFDATITSDNILGRSSIDAIMFNLMDASLILEIFFSGSRILALI